jgi:transcriptional regulator with XRE-family HTH domain
VATRDSALARGRRKGAVAKQRFCDEIILARSDHGVSQAAAAARAGVSRTAWTRYESGVREVPSWDVAGRMAAAVGLDLVVQLYPSEVKVRDIPQLRLLQDAREVLGRGWAWRYEVPVSAIPDQRAWDAVAEHRITNLTVRIDAETRIADWQRIIRRVRAKAEAGGDGRILLIVRDTTRNRGAIRTAGTILADEFPIPMRTAMHALRRGLDPGGDSVLVVRHRTQDLSRAS